MARARRTMPRRISCRRDGDRRDRCVAVSCAPLPGNIGIFARLRGMCARHRAGRRTGSGDRHCVLRAAPVIRLDMMRAAPPLCRVCEGDRTILRRQRSKRRILLRLSNSAENLCACAETFL
jgi:hypothetical protein